MGLIVVRAKLSAEKTATKDAIVDSGSTTGIVLPFSVAKAVGATLCKPRRRPKSADGGVMDGMSAVLHVSIPDAGVAVETIGYCIRSEKCRDILLGAYFLQQVGASMSIGRKTYSFGTSFTRNPMSCEDLDLSDWVIRLPIRWL